VPLVEPDDEQLEERRARRLLELVGERTRAALRFPEEVQDLRTLLAEVLFENGALRLQVERLGRRVDALERRPGGGQ
jgi:hypothetical protein